MADRFLPGDRIEYIGRAVFDGIIDTGEVGWVIRVEAGWVFASWPRSGVHSVPVRSARLLAPEVTRDVDEAPNALLWPVLGEKLPALESGRPCDPYMNQGCHPDIVARVWDELGAELPRDCRALAKGRPVLAHPATDRIIAAARGTAYALWLTPEDFADAREGGAKTVMAWSDVPETDLAKIAGAGWIWGSWYAHEPAWLRRAYAASGSDQRTW